MRLATTVEQRLQEFLKNAGDAPVVLGGQKQASATTPAARDALMTELRRRQPFVRTTMLVVLVLYVFIFAIATAFIISRWQNANAWALIIGQSGSLVALVAVLRSFWREAVQIELLSTILPSLTPDEALRAVQALYYSGKTTTPRNMTPAKNV